MMLSTYFAINWFFQATLIFVNMMNYMRRKVHEIQLFSDEKCQKSNSAASAVEQSTTSRASQEFFIKYETSFQVFHYYLVAPAWYIILAFPPVQYWIFNTHRIYIDCGNSIKTAEMSRSRLHLTQLSRIGPRSRSSFVFFFVVFSSEAAF